MAHEILDDQITQPYWFRDAPPRLIIDSGDTVEFQCPEPCGQVTPDWTAHDIETRWNPDKVHALLGPVDVRGALAGGTLEVEILSIEHHQWAWSGLIPGFGLLHEQFPQAYLHHWSITPRGCEFGVNDIVVPYEPFCGCIGVAPETNDKLDTIPPRDNGGNLDLRDAGVGSVIRLPVFRDGAGLSLGDGHAAQGDGELCGTAVEAPLNITVRITARPETPTRHISIDHQPQAPASSTGRWHTETAVGEDVRHAAQTAARRLLRYVADNYQLDEPQAMVLCSAAGRLRIAQAVNEPHWTIAASMPELPTALS